MKTWKTFMLESNRIEGEDRLNPGDKLAFDFAMTGIDSEEELLSLHEMLTRHLKVDWSGRYRKANVRVGSYTAPSSIRVPALMKDFFEQLHLMDAWTAHNEFEKIHPFRDFNGRVGRLIWIDKMGQVPQIPFLQAYYYQTLERSK